MRMPNGIFSGPLGISQYHWKKTPQGYPDTEGGLYLEGTQLAKFGYLYLHDGMWEDPAHPSRGLGGDFH